MGQYRVQYSRTGLHVCTGRAELGRALRIDRGRTRPPPAAHQHTSTPHASHQPGSQPPPLVSAVTLGSCVLHDRGTCYARLAAMADVLMEGLQANIRSLEQAVESVGWDMFAAGAIVAAVAIAKMRAIAAHRRAAAAEVAKQAKRPQPTPDHATFAAVLGLLAIYVVGGLLWWVPPVPEPSPASCLCACVVTSQLPALLAWRVAHRSLCLRMHLTAAVPVRTWRC
jgi:hypothetical protein